MVFIIPKWLMDKLFEKYVPEAEEEDFFMEKKLKLGIIVGAIILLMLAGSSKSY